MELILNRRVIAERYTIGELKVNGDYFCDTLEDVVRPAGIKINGRTAIPYGIYAVALDYSPKFDRIMPHVLDVPGFLGVRIHPGNTVDDTDGCILVGRNRARGQVLDSKATFAALFSLMAEAVERGENISLTVC